MPLNSFTLPGPESSVSFRMTAEVFLDLLEGLALGFRQEEGGGDEVEHRAPAKAKNMAA